MRAALIRGPPGGAGARAGLIVLLAVAALGGCGGTESEQAPKDAVVSVDGTFITRATFERELLRYEAAYAKARGWEGRKRYYVPPDYVLCVRDRRRATGRRPAAVRAECRRLAAGLKRGILLGLIETEWIEQAARKRGMHVSLQQVREELGLPPERRLRNEVVARRVDILSERIRRRATETYPFVPTDAAVAGYYASHRDYFKQPASRDVIGFAAASRARAVRAARELKAGQDWETVARRYAIARAPDRFPGLPREQLASLGPKLAQRALHARVNAVLGPYPSGGSTWYVAAVRRIHPPFQMTLEQSRDTIAAYLGLDMRRDVRLDFWRRFREHARAHTRCLAEFKVALCDNASRAEFDPYGILHDPVPPRPELPSVGDVLSARADKDGNDQG